MSKSLIYLITIFALWMYFKFSNNGGDKSLAEKYSVEDFDKAQSGSGGAMVSAQGVGRGDIVSPLANVQGAGKGNVSGKVVVTNRGVASGLAGVTTANKGRTEALY